ncbi:MULTISPECIES: formate dehydrogenase accessory sulfurtransferase FdhD [Rhodococcus]|uniref:formate dehydrogenase accessory sulfurtransferase FdhD n=1 Tax=Rhodococcus TaxID=1827 RepID=UPI00057341AB|nr:MULTISPECIES: formate dehydrogenase accessory sulfurtransferase FdhD [Rhodococcus]KHJ73933.1 formate dehydrogenase [Rhodococcus sp. Chr-9]QXF82492.1 formate dehydrogenase accessory sulfurtransferase FdhD [Rhodococcus pyridinivorans]
MGRVTTRARITRLQGTQRVVRPDTVVVEEPLELRVDGTALAVTMRTPGSDIELAQGFLLTEGIVTGRDDIAAIRYCNSTGDDGRNTYNVLDIDLAPGVALPVTGIERNFYTTSSCGVCGKASLDAIRQRSRHSPAHDPVVVDPEVLAVMPSALRQAQDTFDRTGGLHAAGLFTVAGELLALREDVGRHNAVDKIIGWAVEHRRLPLRHTVLLVSGRASFELTQKTVMAGIPILAAVSAPSSLAIDLAHDAGLTLVGFLRGDTMNVYTRAERVGAGNAGLDSVSTSTGAFDG